MRTADDYMLDERDIHDVLRNDRRRIAIGHLRESDGGTASLGALSERVASRETGENPPPRAKRQSAYVSLHQTHLPRLEELGIVDYDAETKEVRLRERVREVEVYMEVVPGHALSWAEYYAALSVLGLVTVAASVLSVPVVSAVSTTAWAVAFLGTVALSAAYQSRSAEALSPLALDR